MEISKWKLTSYIAILLIICIFAFLVAKYFVRSDIDDDDVPIDTSVKLN